MMEHNRPLLIVGGAQSVADGIIVSALEAIAGEPAHWHPQWQGAFVRDIWVIPGQGLNGLAPRWAIQRGLPIQSVSFEEALMGPTRPWGAIIMPGNVTTGAMLAACVAAGIPTVCVDPVDMNIFVADSSLVEAPVATLDGDAEERRENSVGALENGLSGNSEYPDEQTKVDGSRFSPDSVSMPGEAVLSSDAIKAGKDRCKSTRSPAVKAG
jgi:hypothetical protein